MTTNEQNAKTNNTSALPATAVDLHWTDIAINPIENQVRRIHRKYGLTPNLSRLIAGIAYGVRV